MTYDDWKTTEPPYYSDHELCPECERTADKCKCEPHEPEPMFDTRRERDEWRHEAAEQQRLK